MKKLSKNLTPYLIDVPNDVVFSGGVGVGFTLGAIIMLLCWVAGG